MSRPFLKTLIRRDVLESTSDLARQLAVENRVEPPFAVWADRQTRGRGRGSHPWWSDRGSLTFTIVVDPAAHALRSEHEPRLALATAVAVVDAIGSMIPSITAGIRWPNDIEVAGRKLGGILPERIETERGPRLLIGIGLNVRSRLVEAPDEVRRMAISLADLHTAPVEIEALLDAILKRFEVVLEELARDDRDLAARWNQLDTLADCWVRVDLGPRIVAGRGRGIDREGALCLAGEREAFRLFGGQVLRPSDVQDLTARSPIVGDGKQGIGDGNQTPTPRPYPP